MNEKIDVEVVETVDEFFNVPVAHSVLGEITCDFTQFKGMIENRVNECKAMVLTDDNYRSLANTKAGINKSISLLKTHSSDLKKKFLKPFEEYENNVKDCIKMMESAKNSLQDQLDEFDAKIDRQKIEDIKQEFEKLANEMNFKYVKIEQIWNPKWTNKTYKKKDILTDINNYIHLINLNIDVLSEYGEDSSMLVAEYIEKLRFENLLNNVLLNEIISSYNIRKRKIKELDSVKEMKEENYTANPGPTMDFTLKVFGATQNDCIKLATFLKNNGYNFKLEGK